MEFNIEYFYRDQGYEEAMKYTPAEGNKIIYKFSNDYGDYIGQTKFSVRKRAGTHGEKYLEKSESKWSYGIETFGFEDFSITILEECQEGQANEREKFYIAKYNSWKEGFNSTPGGSVWKCPSGKLRKLKVDVRDLFNELDTDMLKAWISISHLLLYDDSYVPQIEDGESLLDAVMKLSEELHHCWTDYSYYAFESEYYDIHLTLWELIYNFKLLNLNSVEICEQINAQYTSQQERAKALWMLLLGVCMRREVLGGDYLTSGHREWTEFIFNYPKNTI